MIRISSKPLRRALAAILLCAMMIPVLSSTNAAGDARLNIESANPCGDVLQVVFFDDSEEAPTADSLQISVEGTPVPAISVNTIDYADPGTSYLVLVDTNTAVTERALPDMQTIAKGLIERLGANDNALIVPIGQTPDANNFSNDAGKLSSSVDALVRGETQTDLYSSLTYAISMLEYDMTLKPRRCLIVMADGLDNTSSGFSALEVGTQVSDSHVPVYVVALTYNTKTPERVQAAKDISALARLSPGGVSILLKNDGVTTSDAVDAIFAQRKHTYLAAVKADAVRAAATVTSDAVTITLTHKTASGELSAGRQFFIGDLPTLAPKPSDTPAPTGTATLVPASVPTAEPIGRDEVTLPLWLLYAVGAVVVSAALTVLLVLIKKKRVGKSEKKAAVARFEKTTAQPVPPAQENPVICIVRLGEKEEIVFEGALKDPILLGTGERTPILEKGADEEDIATRLVWRDGTIWAMQNREGVLVNGAPARKNACLSVGDVLRVADAEYRIFYSANE